MDEEYFDRIFTLFRDALKKKGKGIPSVSAVASKRPDPYSVLISTLISLRTKDEVTEKASERLLSVTPTPEEMLKLSEEEVANLICPAGFYKRKAKQIKEVSKRIVEEFDGKVPSTQEELLSLPGVGIKTANLTLNLGFGIDAICVDCHVHEISNRLGWIKTKKPEDSVKELEKVMPKRFWIPLNELLVSYGQRICVPLSPKCSECPVFPECPKIGVKHSR